MDSVPLLPAPASPLGKRISLREPESYNRRNYCMSICLEISRRPSFQYLSDLPFRRTSIADLVQGSFQRGREHVEAGAVAGFVSVVEFRVYIPQRVDQLIQTAGLGGCPIAIGIRAARRTFAILVMDVHHFTPSDSWGELLPWLIFLMASEKGV